MKLKLIGFIFLAVNLFALTPQEKNNIPLKEVTKNVYQTDRCYRWCYNRDCYGYRGGCGWGDRYGYRGGCYGYRGRGCYGYIGGYR